MFLDEIKDVFNCQIEKIEERLEYVKITLFVDWSVERDLNTCFNKIILRDRMSVKIIYDIDESFVICSHKEFEKIRDKLSMQFHIQNTKVFETEICIEKVSEEFTLYNVNSFVKWMKSKSIKERMLLFSKILNGKKYISFRCYDLNREYKTNSICFIPKENNVTYNSCKRLIYLSELRENNFFYNRNSFDLLPCDFIFLEEETFFEFKDIFQSIAVILSIIFISEYSEIEGNTIYYRLTGYINIEDEISLEHFNYNENFNCLIEIYKWIYSTGSKSDKLQIARNAISIHVRNGTILDVSSKTIYSIRTNYKLYLKKNVELYLQTRKEITGSLIEIINEIEQEIKGLATHLSGNIGAGLVYIISLLVSNAFSENKMNEIFTKDITNISSWILIASFAFSICTMLIGFVRYSTLEKRIERIKQNYMDVLDEHELNDIFSDDLGVKDVKIDFGLTMFIVMSIWILLIGISGYAIDCMSQYPVLWLFNLY